MTAHTLIEAMALGMCAQVVAEKRISYDTPCTKACPSCKSEARAALQAMLVHGPTEAMVEAGEHAWMHRDLSDDESNPLRDAFRAMIRAALEEPNG